ncbi:MAG: hypothetical protein COB67_00535 [SAR324 cluster bacterium]|uniref:Uncharacterized protein n=1 Tax=SAR324 cluster bacterium TaxID=2024889 RepID=A0A2A4TCX1_9DELT|nr:MAG: hypothetical protein COB67_00535 [SAR324 cluster bacterium]
MHTEDGNTEWTEDGNSLDELEDNLSHRLIYDRNNENNCTLDYLFEDQQVVDCKVKIKLVNIEK